MPEAIPGRDPALRRSLGAVLLLSAVLIVAAWLRVDTAGATLFGVEGPNCPVGATLGDHACPGCGLTRGTALLVQGRFSEALSAHVGSVLIVLACAMGLLVHGHVLLTRRRSPSHDQLLRRGRGALAVGLLIAWGLRLATPVA